jgi:hypothetical protein
VSYARVDEVGVLGLRGVDQRDDTKVVEGRLGLHDDREGLSIRARAIGVHGDDAGEGLEVVGLGGEGGKVGWGSLGGILRVQKRCCT